MLKRFIKWCDNMWYYYKYFIVAYIILGSTAVAIVYQFIERVIPDLRVGSYQVNLTIQERSVLMDYFAKAAVDVNNDSIVQVGLTPMSDYMQLRISIANQANTMLIIKQDILEQHAPLGAFSPLEHIIDMEHPLVVSHPEVIATNKRTGEKHIYGFPLDGNKIFRNMDLPEKNIYIVMLRRDIKIASENQGYFDNAEKVIKMLMNDSI